MELFMEQFVGLDVSQKLTHISVIDHKGVVVWRGTCLSTPEDMATTIRARAPHAVRIGLETGPLSTWHWHALKKMGLPVICIDARHAKAALSMQINKTDKNDAEGLAQIMRTGWYREVGVKSLDSHKIRAVLGARAQLVGIRTDLKNQIRGLLKVFGVVLQRDGRSFEQQVTEASQGNSLFGSLPTELADGSQNHQRTDGGT
jgi:transposase